MKTLMKHAILAAVLLAGLAPLLAEDAGSPESTFSLNPGPVTLTPSEPAPRSVAAPGAPLPESPPSLPLIPQALPGIPPAASVTGSAQSTPAQPAPVSASVSVKGSAEQLRQAIRIRELKTKVLLADAEVNAQRALADRARTPNGRRAALRNYYALLYTKIEKLDPTLKDTMEGVLYGQLLGLEQHRLVPAPLVEAIRELPGSHSDDHKPPGPAPTPTPVATPAAEKKNDGGGHRGFWSRLWS